MSICLLGFLPPCFTSAQTLHFTLTKFVMIPAGVLQAFLIALYSIFDYKLPYSIIDIKDYGKLVSSSGIISNVFCITLSFILSFCMKHFEYKIVMTYAFSVSAIFVLIASFVNQTLKIYQTDIKSDKFSNAAKSVINLIKMPSFYIFIIPNFLRGISMGLISVLAMIALDLGYGSSTVSSIVTITYLANFAGSFLYLVLSKHLNEQILCMLGALCIGAVVFAPNRSDFAFLVVCFITLSGKIIVDYAVPSRIYKLTSIETAGMYHAWRQLITNAGTALSAAGSGFIIQNGMSHFLLIITFAAQIICSLFYLLYNRDRTHM